LLEKKPIFFSIKKKSFYLKKQKGDFVFSETIGFPKNVS